MLMFKERWPTIRTPRGWSISVLQEAGALREYQEHGWIQDRSAQYARERALGVVGQDPPRGGSPEEAIRVRAMSCQG